MRSRSRLHALVVAAAVLLAGLSAAVAGGESMSADEGRMLYQRNCSGCHGDLGESAKSGRSMNRIRTAIRTLQQHRQFESLSDGQLLLIAMVLKDADN